ncbi:hypothetical protein M2163_003453 [Streptomyces sp. SAI-135]|uniref:hypothetical protein n=1 Tax=unclassified Streptomyces TaxID=2593676 RepID=UPI002473E331|nr:MULTISPECIES: hypothetical protein [unclassified Streptomyces]MDH6519562.1 hypothetical protein [Streptomyces sp. SAI-090]MDH6616345.1 hypothetical protein [Streptomyces sp. SAI-135]
MGGDSGNGAAAAVRLAEGAALREVMDTADPAAWTALDAGVREAAWSTDGYQWLPAWEAEAGRALAEALTGDSGARPLTEGWLALGLCHRQGRIRAAALEQAAARPELLPLMVVRCSDWAPPVRERARRLLVERLDAESAVRLMTLILRVGRRGRGDFVTDLATRLLLAAPRETFAPLYTDPDRTTRRYAYRLAVEEGYLSPAELARAAARETDTVIQSLCADAALAGLAQLDADGQAGPARDGVLAPLLGARGAQPRAAGVTALRRAGRSAEAEGFLGDRAGVVRACARYVLRQAGGDPHAWYRERCGRGDLALPAGAVSGLAECGVRADAGLLWALTSHAVAAVRARAVGGLRALDATDVARMRELLDDPAPGVVREAALALLPSARMLDERWLMRRLAAEQPRQVRVSAFRLLNAHEGLVRLRAAVALLDEPDDRLRYWARQSVERWRPTADVPRGSAEVGELLERARLFPTSTLKRLKWEAGIKA